MAATRKLQGEEKVFPACLHLDISPFLRPRHRGIGPDGRPGRRRGSLIAIAGLARVRRSRVRVCANRAKNRDARLERTVPGVSRGPIQRRSPNGCETGRRYGPGSGFEPVDLARFVLASFPRSWWGLHRGQRGGFLFCRHNL